VVHREAVAARRDFAALGAARRGAVAQIQRQALPFRV